MASDSEILNLQSAADIGSALKALREQKKLSLEQLADMTRVRRVYLADIEAMRLDRLPSRPFTIGYISVPTPRPWALDGDAAVERFKSEEPVLDEPLRAPVGVVQNGDPRAVAIVAGVIVILVAIVLWNIAQRALMAGAPPPPTASAQATAKALSETAPPGGALGAPLPAPVESTTPPPYETPGMPIINPDGNVTTPKSIQGAKSGLTPETPAGDPSTLSAVFVATGQIYGAPKDQPSSVTLQALKPASLIVRGQDGQIYFARQFAAGDAFRVPQVGGPHRRRLPAGQLPGVRGRTVPVASCPAAAGVA